MTHRIFRLGQPGRAASSVTLSVLGWASTMLMVSCNVIVDTNTAQCTTHADCRTKGAAYADSLCTAEKVCARPQCESSSECLDAFGDLVYCGSNSVCTKLEKKAEYTLVPDIALLRNQAYVVGFMATLSGQDKSYGTPLRQGAELALSEIEERVMPGTEGQPTRHLAVLVADELAGKGVDATLEDRQEVVRSLIEDSKVQAIIGPAYSSTTIKAAFPLAKSAGVLVISPSATSPDITDLKDRDLVWRIAPSDTIQALLLALLVKDVENDLLSTNPNAKAKVAVLVHDDDYGNGIAGYVSANMLDPVGVQAALNEEILRRDYQFKTDSETDIDAIALANEVINFRPHVILGLGTAEFAKQLMSNIELAWGDDGSYPRPKYLLPEGVKVDWLQEQVKKRSDLAGRILGTAPGARSTVEYKGFAERFDGMFREQPGNLAEFAYDAVYLLAYAIAVSGKPSPSGLELADALKKMTSGTKVRPEPNRFAFNFQTAAQEKIVDFDGISGPLTFDAHGEAPSDIALWCPTGSAFITLKTYYPSDMNLTVPWNKEEPGENINQNPCTPRASGGPAVP